MKTKISLLLTFLVGANVLHAQGIFQNLDFEQATIVSIPTGPGGLPLAVASGAIPGWTAYIDNSPVDWLWYNSLTLGSPAVSIHDGQGTYSFQPLQGNYSVALQHSVGTASITAGIGQTGQLPLDAKSIVFDSGYTGVNPMPFFGVTFAGNPIPIVDLGSTPDYYLVGGDISAYAGQTGELRFTALPRSGVGGPGFLYFDDIRFSSQAVPEPSVLALSVVGGLLLGWRWRRKS